MTVGNRFSKPDCVKKRLGPNFTATASTGVFFSQCVASSERYAAISCRNSDVLRLPVRQAASSLAEASAQHCNST